MYCRDTTGSGVTLEGTRMFSGHVRVQYST
jgi:hypothetical protein